MWVCINTHSHNLFLQSASSCRNNHYVMPYDVFFCQRRKRKEEKRFSYGGVVRNLTIWKCIIDLEGLKNKDNKTVLLITLEVSEWVRKIEQFSSISAVLHLQCVPQILKQNMLQWLQYDCHVLKILIVLYHAKSALGDFSGYRWWQCRDYEVNSDGEQQYFFSKNEFKIC